MRLLKYCNKVIVSDALIHDNVVNFLKCRKQNNKTLYINNTYQKYKDKKAYRVRDETQFLEKRYTVKLRSLTTSCLDQIVVIL